MKVSVMTKLIIAATALIAGTAFTFFPLNMDLPIHWNASGEVDREASAVIAIIMPVVISLAMIGLLSVLSKLEPRKENLNQSEKGAGGVILAVALFMLVVESGYFALIAGYVDDMRSFIWFGLGLMFMVLGNYLSKVRSNFFIGLRTPWTLSSETVWAKTHRVGGRLIMISGAIIWIGGLVLNQQQVGLIILMTVLPAVLFSTAYSWWLWRQESEANS